MWHTIHRCFFIFLSLTCADALLVFRKGPVAADSAVKPTSLVLGEHQGLLGVRKAPPLVPRAGSSSFKVLQLADLHLGEDFDGDWGPRQDRKTMAVVEALLDNEKPDLVVFSGDQITGEGLHMNASRREMLLNKLEEPLKKRGVPWATIFGNHDACDTPGCRTGAGNSQNILLLSGKHQAPTQSEVDKAHKDLLDSMKKNLVDVIVRPSESTGTASSAPAPAGMASPASAPLPPESIAGASPAAAPEANAKPVPPAAAAPASAPLLVPPKSEPAAALPVPPAAAAPAAPDAVANSPPAEPSTGNDAEAAAASSTGNDADHLTVHHVASMHASTTWPPHIPAATMHALQPHAFLHHSTGAVQNLVAHGTGNGWREKYLQHEFASSLSRTGVDGMFESSGGGKSNYWLKIFDSDEDSKADRPSFLLWFIDTGGGGLSEDLHADQLEWLSRESAAMEARYGPLPGALYAHIPLQEFGQVEPGQQSQSCNGVSDDSVTPVRAGTSLFPLLSKMHISWVFAGHNHGNDWCCRVGLGSSSAGALKQPDIELCYGRHSGYGGYSTPGLHLRGARVFELHPGMAKRFLRGQGSDSGVQSWVRLEDGSKGPHWSEKL